MNETLKTIAARWSCRDFTDRMPPDDLLRAVADAAAQAPSAMNRQAWRVIVVKDRALMGDMETEALRALASMPDRSAWERIQSRGGKVFYGAPCMIMVPIDRRGHSHAAMDCGILCQNVALAAASLGLGNVICGMAGLIFTPERAQEFTRRLGFPEGFEFGCSVLLGYARGGGRPHAPDPEKIRFVE